MKGVELMIVGLGCVVGIIILYAFYPCMIYYAYKKSLEEYPYKPIVFTDSHGRERIIKTLTMKEQEKLIKELEKKEKRKKKELEKKEKRTRKKHY